MDYANKGSNLSRIRLEGAGGFIYALTPFLILAIGAGWGLLGWMVAGAALAPLVHLQLARHRALTDLEGGLWVVAVIVALAAGFAFLPGARVFVLACLASAAVLAKVLHLRRPLGDGLSIRRYGR